MDLDERYNVMAEALEIIEANEKLGMTRNTASELAWSTLKEKYDL